MLPDLRKMVARLEDEPFTLLGINSDGMDAEALKAKFEKSGVVWPNLFEAQERAISREWNVQGYPTIYVLDHQGVIQMKGFLDKATVAARVDELLSAVPGSSTSGSR